MQIAWLVVGYAVLGAAVVGARRWPDAALVVAVATWAAGSVGSVGVWLAGGVALVAYLAGRHAADRGSGPVVLVLGAATTTATALPTAGGDAAVAALAGVGVLALVPWSTGRFRSRYAQLAAAGWDQAERMELAADRARGRERVRLAAEMHDLIGHELANAALRVGALELTLAGPDRETAKAARTSVTAAAERLADTVRVLRAESSALPEPTVEESVAAARQAGLAVTLRTTGEQSEDPVITRTVRRVLREAVTNALKHAPTSPLTIALTNDETGTHLNVTSENGLSRALPIPHPFPGASRLASVSGGGGGVGGRGSNCGWPEQLWTTAAGGHGLVGLAERVGLVGGRFEAGPVVGGGFAVVAHLPRRPAVPASTAASRAVAERGVRRSGRRAVVVATAVAIGVVGAVVGYVVFDAASSRLTPAEFERLRVGQRVETAHLPGRTRTDDSGGCRHYSVAVNPFAERGDDLYRVCFADGRLVGKALVER
ncbi:sensor histidine kinase [Actinophytocola xanthii]|uniref:histidine kinase n=1 Tax=Actinophytocola xanthii TaxID=1912961 RepID=A0A1Q8C3J6_9PSEU|nr:histidine kinase [Actinophytocola xanthii]OLF08923.1 hypothetical protein BU204_33510 [Actinophytocola xanthii]